MMPNNVKPIDSLPAASTLTGAERIEISQGTFGSGSSRHTTLAEGAIAVALFGDVTKPINSTAMTIAADAVTYGKIQNVTAAARLLGRGSASGAGDVEEIAISTGLTMSSTTLLVDVATTAQFRANSATKVLTTDQVWAAAALVALTDAATIAVDMSTFLNATVTLGGNRTLGNPTNTKEGQTGLIYVVQDGSGSKTLGFGSNYKFAGGTPPTMSTGAGKVDRLTYAVRSSTHIDIDFSADRR